MATYVNDLRLKEIATGDESGTWGDTTNTNLELIAEAFSYGTEAITTNADTHTTTIADGATDPGRSMYLKYTGTLDSACTITIGPNTISKMWFIENATSGSQNIIISQGSGANITIPPGDVKVIYTDGAGSGAAVVDAFASLSVVDLKVQDDLTVTDDLIVNGDIDLEGNMDVNGSLETDALSLNGTTVTSTAAEINLLDGSSANTVVNSKAVIYGSSGQVAGTLSTAAQPNITSVGTLSSLVVDDITINGSNITDSGDIYIDVGGDIHLNADGGDIKLEDDTIEFGRISNSASSLQIYAPVQDKDINFLGNDGGSTITALTLDMSNAGAATFNSTVSVAGVGVIGATDGDLNIYSTTANHGGLRLGNGYVGPTNNAGTITNDAISLGLSGQRFTNLYLSDSIQNSGKAGSGTVFNEDGTTADFRVESDGNTHMFFVDGGTNKIAIGHTVPDSELHIIANGNDAQMPLIIGNEDHTDNSTSQSVAMGFGLARDSGTVKNNAGLIKVGKTAAWTGDDSQVDSYMSLSIYKNNAVIEHLKIEPTQIVVNETGADADFRVESDGNTHMLFVDGGNDAVGIGTSTPGAYYSGAEQLVVAKASGEAGITVATASDTNGALYFADGTTGAAAYQGGIGYQHANSKLFFVEGGVATCFLGPDEYVFNEPGVDRDFRVESNNHANMLRVDGGTDRVAVKLSTSEPENTLDVNGDISFTRTVSKKVSTGAANSNYFVIYEKDFESSAFTTNQHFVRIIGAGSTNGSHASAEFNVTFKQQSGSKYFNIVPIENSGLSIGYTYDASGGASSAGKLKIFAASTVGFYTYIQVFATARDGNSDDAIARGTFPMTDTGSGTAPTGMTTLAFPLSYSDNKYTLGGGHASNEFVINDDSNDLDFRVESNGNTHMLFVDGGNNRVGIGTSSVPANRTFQVSSSDIVPIEATSSGGETIISIDNTATNGRSYFLISGGTSGTYAGGKFGIYDADAAADRMSIDSSGNVTFNEGSLDSDFRVESNGNAYMLFVDGGSDAVRIGHNAAVYSGGEKMSILANNTEGVGIQTTTASKQCLGLYNSDTSGNRVYIRFAIGTNGTEVGSITSTGSATSYNTTSDARLKDVTGSARGLEVINELNPVSYNWKADDKADEGLIAQEVMEIVPNAVSGSEEEMYQMDYSKLVVHLVAGMKEQQTQIEALQSEINLLKGE